MVKNLPANAGDSRDADSIPGSGRSPGGGKGNALKYSCQKFHGQRSLLGYSLCIPFHLKYHVTSTSLFSLHEFLHLIEETCLIDLPNLGKFMAIKLFLKEPIILA